MSTVSPDSVAQDQIRSFVERIMRLREEVKAINGDIREVYAEAKGNGFDKTVLGKVVNYIEKRATSAGELAEGEALFDLYLAAFDGATRVGTPVATHTHEAVGYDRLTGEVRDDIAGNGASGAETVVRPAASAPVSAQPLQQDSAEVARGAHNPEVAGSIPAPATKSEPASPPTEIAEPGDRGAVIPAAAPVVADNVMTFRTHNPETHFLNSEGLSRLHGCLKPELCGSSEPRKRLCFNCSLQHDGPTHQAEAG